MRRQSGMSFSSVVALVALIALLIKAAIAIVPMYWDNKMLTTVLDTMAESGEVTIDSKPNKVKQLLEQRMLRNGLRMNFEQLTIQPHKHALVLDWPYEVRGTWLANIDLVVRFHQHKEFTHSE
jgi:hypothetical protein